MKRRIISSDLTNRRELSLCIEILNGCMMRSGDDLNYIDLDILPTATGCRIPKILADRIRNLQRNSFVQPNKIVLIEKRAGPIGMIPYHGSLMVELGEKGPQVLILRKKNTLRGIFAGGQNISEDDNVLIVDDVAMTGWTINEAAHLIWGFGATIVGALTLFDRSQGAAESLANSGIDLFSVYCFDEILNSNEAIRALLQKGLPITKPEKSIVEFGSV